MAGVLGGPGPSLVLLSGIRGTGKSTLVSHMLRSSDAPSLRFTAAPVTEPDQRVLLRTELERIGWLEDPADSNWTSLFETIRSRVESTDRTRTVVVLDGAHDLFSERGRVAREVLAFWQGVRAHALPVHLVLVGTSPHLERALEEAPPELVAAADTTLHLGPLPYRAVTDHVLGHDSAGRYGSLDALHAWSVFGAHAATVSHLDPSRSLAANVRSAFLEPDAPLGRLGLDALDVQSPPRYVSILSALAAGARSWGEIRSASPGFTSGNQIAPYMARLEELGLVVTDRSLDAGPRSRNRRYRIVDPALAFWYRFLLPRWSEAAAGRGADLWSRDVRPGLDRHLDSVLPSLGREWLLRHGDEVLPARAREAGGLWGGGYDLPVSGTLETGATVYGKCVTGRPATAEVADVIDADLRETRYGFGREARLRVVFSGRGVDAGMERRVAKDRLVFAVGPEALVGPERPHG